MHNHLWLFVWLLGLLTQALMLAQQAPAFLCAFDSRLLCGHYQISVGLDVIGVS